MTIIKSKKLLWSGAMLLMNGACDFPCKPLGLPDKISFTIHYLLVKILPIKEKKPFINEWGKSRPLVGEKTIYIFFSSQSEAFSHSCMECFFSDRN